MLDTIPTTNYLHSLLNHPRKLDFCEFNINVFLIAVSLLVHSCVYSGLLWIKLGLINHETSMYYLKNNDFNLP